MVAKNVAGRRHGVVLASCNAVASGVEVSEWNELCMDALGDC